MSALYCIALVYGMCLRYLTSRGILVCVVLNFSMTKIVRQPYENGPFNTLSSLGELNRVGRLVRFVPCFSFLFFSLFLQVCSFTCNLDFKVWAVGFFLLNTLWTLKSDAYLLVFISAVWTLKSKLHVVLAYSLDFKAQTVVCLSL